MRLTELVNSVAGNFREVSNFFRYPGQTISRILWRRAQEEYEKVELTGGKNSGDKQSPVQQTTRTRTLDANAASAETSETASAVKIAVAEQLARRQSRGTEAIPILTKGQEIRGRRGRYRINDLLKDGERVRLYEGELVVNNKPILIKEYLLLDREFNQKEAKERKEKFERVASVNLKNGAGQDFRVISPWDAIAPPNEKRCYLIGEQSVNSNLSLREYLAKNGPMNSPQVRRVLIQVLQTLWFLHSQRLRLSSDDLRQGLPHGNLNLDSLLISTNKRESAIDDLQFFIYVCDLALWEDIFKPPTAKIVNHSAEKDLIDLGYVSFYQLSGGTLDRVFAQPLDPNIEQHWPSVKDIALKRFIYRLLGIDKPFASADEALQVLLKMPPEEQVEEQVEAIAEAERKDIKSTPGMRVLLTALLIGILAGLMWQIMAFGWRSLIAGKSKITPASNSVSSANCCFANVEKIVIPKKVIYVFEADGTWNYILNNSSLVSYGQTLESELKTRATPILDNFKFNNSATNEIKEVREGRADFALTVGNDKLPPDLKQEVVAYDGLVVFVAFSDNQRKLNVPSAFKGKITIAQLAELYSTGKLKNWIPPQGLKNRINLYIPLDSAVAIQNFKRLVFKGKISNKLIELRLENKKKETQNKEKNSNKKRAEIYARNPDKSRWRKEKLVEEQRQKIQNRKNDESYIAEEVLKDFEENQTIAVGFGLLSRVFGQCSVYPLAVGEKQGEIQALVQKVEDEVEPINTKTDLCNDKGSYSPNVDAFTSGSYPLMYRLVVVYPKDENRSLAGKKFAELLKTDEGQRLLSEAGLVPIRSLPNN